MHKISITDIDFELEYEGYLWYSNAKQPEWRKHIRQEDFTELPFIVEGNLFSSKSNLSISIKYLDGAYYLHRVVLADIPNERLTRCEYLLHGKEPSNKIIMAQYWDMQPDSLLEGLNVMVPTWQAFIGFK